jgi:hypothetical protein
VLTLFAIPKSFEGESGPLQRNALESWVRMRPACEILLMGDDPGVAAAAAAFGARHFPSVPRNAFGTPMLDGAFALAEREGSARLLCYVNADILLPTTLPEIARRIPCPRFLMSGQRWDIDLPAPLDFDAPDWEGRLLRVVELRGTLHGPAGGDWFVFPRGTMGPMLPFAVGRPGWDNWFLHRAAGLGIPLIDATACVTAVHQTHGYGHIRQGTGQVWEGPEADANRALAGGECDWRQIATLDDATHLLTASGLVPAMTERHIQWRLARRADRHRDERVRNGLIALLRASRRILPDAWWRRLVHELA